MAAIPFRFPELPEKQLLVRTSNRLRFDGRVIRVQFRDELSAWRGKLLSRSPRGQRVHAGSFLRRRRIVLDRELLANHTELRRIFVHEVFHFVWSRLGNQRRTEYMDLIAAELGRRARGELGWSAESMKERIVEEDIRTLSRRFRDYVCESFCDTAAFLYAGLRNHEEFTLAKTHRQRRAQWFAGVMDGQPLSV